MFNKELFERYLARNFFELMLECTNLTILSFFMLSGMQIFTPISYLKTETQGSSCGLRFDIDIGNWPVTQDSHMECVSMTYLGSTVRKYAEISKKTYFIIAYPSNAHKMASVQYLHSFSKSLVTFSNIKDRAFG